MSFPLLPFVTSFGALLFEFSLAQYLAMALGNSAFGYAFVVGSFLLAMGAGSWLGDKDRGDALVRLAMVEIALVLLCLSALPFLAWFTGFSKGWALGADGCRALICEAPGLALSAVTFVFLLLTGVLVGAEIPLFLKAFPWRLGQVLAADYVGAFAAGLVFPFLALPELGLAGSLALAGLCHGLSALFLLKRLKRPVFAAVGALGVVAALAMLVQSEKVERTLIGWITARVDATRSEVLTFFRTRKQTVLYVEDTLTDGSKDKRFYLDGFLQFSSAWNQDAYHKAMVLPARNALDKKAARVLILGGGDGLAAEALLSEFPQDHVKIVDFDEGLLGRVITDPVLRSLAPKTWDSPNVETLVADAFWFVRRDKSEWDLILVDFPHGVGDAAAAKVESWEFFRDLRARLVPGGAVVLQHESFGSRALTCVVATLQNAGFLAQAVPVSEDLVAEAMITGRSFDGVPVVPEGQTALNYRCQGDARRFAIWLGA